MMIARCNWQLDVLIDPDPSRQFAGYRPELRASAFAAIAMLWSQFLKPLRWFQILKKNERSLTASLLGRHARQIVRQQPSQIADFDDEPFAVAATELWKPLTETLDSFDELRLVPDCLLSGKRHSLGGSDRLRGGTRTQQHENGRPRTCCQIHRSKRVPQLLAVVYDKSRYLELVQSYVLKIERDADLKDGGEIEADVTPGSRALTRPHAELNELADPARERGWRYRICHVKWSSEGVPKRQHCLAALVRTYLRHPIHHMKPL
jgi:hypothetical protein